MSASIRNVQWAFPDARGTSATRELLRRCTARRWGCGGLSQQVHLDIEVGDLDDAETLAFRLGATPLRDDGDQHVDTDPTAYLCCV